MGSAGGDESCTLIHVEEGTFKFEKQILNLLKQHKHNYLNHEEWINCSLEKILETFQELKERNHFEENKKLYLEKKEQNLKHLILQSTDYFQLFISEIIEDFNHNKKYLKNENLDKLLYEWLDYEVLFYQHTLLFIENIDFFVPNIKIMTNNLFHFIQNIFTIKEKLTLDIKKQTLQHQYFNILNKKVYDNKDIIVEYMDTKMLDAKTYWSLKNKVNYINTNINIVQLSQMIYRNEEIGSFETSIKLI